MKHTSLKTRVMQAMASFSLAFTVLGSSMAFADEIISLNALPQNVVKSINERFPGAKYLTAERDTFDDGSIEYDVLICYTGKMYEVELNLSGVITDVDYEGQCTN